MNPATVQTPRTPKRSLIADLSVRAALQRDTKTLVVLSDDLSRRWERIARGDRQ